MQLKEETMKKISIIILLSIASNSCQSQENFDKFIGRFKPVNLPLNKILLLHDVDTLNGKRTNDILIRSKKERPKYIDKNGDIQMVKKYYGLYPEKPHSFLKDIKNEKGQLEERRIYFYPKVIPIGRIALNPNYISLVIKVVDYEATFYDLWNFSKDGEALSVVCLFWGIRDAGPRDEKVTFTIVSSEVAQDGRIVWHENNDGLETFRTYKLNRDGYFQIIKEEQKGDSKY